MGQLDVIRTRLGVMRTRLGVIRRGRKPPHLRSWLVTAAFGRETKAKGYTGGSTRGQYLGGYSTLDKTSGT